MEFKLKLISNTQFEHDDDLLTEDHHWITHTPYVKYFKQTFLFENKIISNYPIMMYMSFPGFVTIEPVIHDEISPSEEEIYNQGLRYVNHEFDMLESKGIKDQNIRLKNHEKNRRTGKELRRTLKTWNMTLKSMGNDFFHKERHGCEISLKNMDAIVNLDNKSEIFFPMCFKERGQIKGGMYAASWETTPDLKNMPENLEFDSFITGGCLFGNEVFGFDDQGRVHPLTNPRHEITDMSVIQKIEYISDMHSDEVLTLQSFKNLIPLLKAFSSTPRPQVIYHIPASEYILNVIHHYIHNRITMKACLDYIELVSFKEQEHMNALYDIAAQNNIDIKFDSPLEPLMNQLKLSEDVITGLLKLTGLPMLDLFENEELVFSKVIEYLCKHSGKYKTIWQKISTLINEGKIEKSSMMLPKLSHLSYCANLATPRLKQSNLNVCSILPGHEKRVQLTYKHLFSETFGSVYCINWFPPLLIKSEAHYNAVFFINEKLNKRVKNLLDLNLVDRIFKSIGGVAVDDRQFVMTQMEEIFLTLCAVHSRKSIEKILRSLI